jgi:hypothetical protein
MDDENILIAAVADLQAEVGALQRVIELLLAHFVLNHEDPLGSLDELKAALGAASRSLSKHAGSAEGADYASRVNEQTDTLIEQVRTLVAAMKDDE